MSVVVFTSRSEKWLGDGRKEDTTEVRCEDEREQDSLTLA